jgi:primosomal protein N' (replication factor Y)
VIVARVLPNVTGLDKHFDYLVPKRFASLVTIGTIVRLPLHGRRVGGWVTALAESQVDPDSLKEIAAVTGAGPSVELIELAEWAAVRWAARRRHFLATASPERAVRQVPGGRRTGRVVEPRSGATTTILESGGGVLRLPPTADPLPCVYSAVALGPTLVVVPGLDDARLMGARLRRAGLTVAVMPDDWALAAGGVDIVIGARTAAWAPCPGIAAAVVIDEHDEAMQSERSPTWHSRDVVVERCRLAGVPAVAVSPCPTVSALHWHPATRPPVSRERDGWPIVDVVDRSDQEPWRRSLVTSALIGHIRDHDRRVVCVLNTTGRARLLACRRCRALARCERCEGAVAVLDTGGPGPKGPDSDGVASGALVCGRCGTVRPAVCLECGSSAFANLRPGVARLGEELTAAAGRPAVTVTGADQGPPPPAGLYLGTEAVLHRVAAADVVVFVDFDRELLAPRYRASERAMSLLARAARLVGPRGRGGRIVVQTLLPGHEVIRSAVLADPGRLADHDALRRRALGLPPYRALAAVSGAGSDDFVADLHGVEVAGGAGSYLIRADDWMSLGVALLDARRPRGSRLRIAVDPPDV